MLPHLMFFETLEWSLPPVDISPEPVDGFQKYKWQLEAENILYN